MIAVMAALEPEVAPIIESLDSTDRRDLASFVVWEGEANGRPVLVALAGMGKVATSALAGMIWSHYRPDGFVFSGVAGGLAPDIAVGDIVIGTRSLQHDWGMLEPGGLQRYQAGHLPIYHPTDELGFEASGELLTRARRAVDEIAFTPVLGHRPRVHFGLIATGDQFINDVSARDRLHADTGALAVDMEAAALAQFCELVGAQHLVVRSMSDRAGEETIDDFAQFVPPVAHNSAQVVRTILQAS